MRRDSAFATLLFSGPFEDADDEDDVRARVRRAALALLPPLGG